MSDRTISVGGGVNNSILSTGDNATITQTVTTNTQNDMADFIALIAELKQDFSAANVDAALKQSLKGNLELAEQQAKQDNPDGSLIKSLCQIVADSVNPIKGTLDIGNKVLTLVEKAEKLFAE